MPRNKEEVRKMSGKTFGASQSQAAHATYEPHGSLKICVYFGGGEYLWLTLEQVKFMAADYGKDWKEVWAEGMKNRLLYDLESMGWLPGVIEKYEYTDDTKTSVSLTVQHNAEWRK